MAGYAARVKGNSKQKRPATPEEVIQLARRVKWRDIHLPGGGMVTAETTRQIFADAEKALNSPSRRKRAHAAVA